MTATTSTPQPAISLRICGTKERRAGFAPLVPVGVLFNEEETKNFDRVTQVNESPTYVVKHYSDHVTYILSDRHVKSFDADAPGVLIVAIAIPRGKSISGGRTPFTLLTELYNRFREESMVPLADGNYRFINKDTDDAPYRALLASYSDLEPQMTPYVEMASQGPTATLRIASDEQLSAFTADSNYPELRNFGWVEIGKACATTPALENLEIPRRTEYTVNVNGSSTGRKLKYGSDSYTTEIRDNANLWDYTNVTFDLQQIIDSPTGELSLPGGATAKLNRQNSTIYVNVPKTRRQDTVRINIIGTNDEIDLISKAIQEKKILIRIDDKHQGPELIAAGKDGIRIDAVEKQHHVNISPEQIGNLEVKSEAKTQMTAEGKLITLTLTARQKAIPQSPKMKPAARTAAAGGGGGLRPGGMNNPTGNQQPQTPPQQTPAPEPTPSRKPDNNMIMLIGAAVLGLIIGAVAVWFCYPLFNKSDANNATYKEQYEKLLKENEKLQDRIQELQADNQAAGSSTPSFTEEPVSIPDPAEIAAEEPDATKAAQDAEKAKKVAEEKAKKEQEKANANQKIAEAHAKILPLVNAGKLTEIRKLPEWKSLSKEDQLAVEAVLNLKQYDDQNKKKAVRDLLNSKYNNGTFNSWNQLLQARKEIISLK